MAKKRRLEIDALLTIVSPRSKQSRTVRIHLLDVDRDAYRFTALEPIWELRLETGQRGRINTDLLGMQLELVGLER